MDSSKNSVNSLKRGEPLARHCQVCGARFRICRVSEDSPYYTVVCLCGNEYILQQYSSSDPRHNPKNPAGHPNFDDPDEDGDET